MSNLKFAVTGRGSIITAGAVLGALLCGCSAVGPVAGQSIGQPGRITFAVIGDLGYVPQEEPGVDNVFADLNRDASLAFVTHIGDLSAPRYACVDELRARRLGQFQASVHPVVFIPGDNDWTDCHEPAVKGSDPLERLDDLRQVFFPNDETLGQRTFALTRQSQGADSRFTKYRENARWDLGGVTFLTLHVVASNNGLGRTPEGDAEFAERNAANQMWLREGFDHAKRNDSRAVMVLQQANLFPQFSPFPGNPKKTSGFTDIREQLRKESKAFGKPVALIHGDSHYFRIDKPLSPLRIRGQPVVTELENFTRVETFGSPYSHWLHVTVDPGDPNVFTFRQKIVEANVTPQK
jgi:hypothetical protein